MTYRHHVLPQPKPIDFGGKEIIPLVIEDFHNRMEFGRQKYGTVLKSNNGRINWVDAYQELLDLLVYLKCELIETDMEPTELW